MGKTILLFLISFIFFDNAYSQITKGNWLMGGKASFSFSNPVNGNVKGKVNEVNISPDIGYFFIDKLAAGVRISYDRDHQKFEQPGFNYTFANFTTYSIGPFIRYYFLPIDQQYNILSELSYQFGKDKSEDNLSYSSTLSSNSFTFSAGPVIYFNTSVGLEFLLNYTSGGNNLSNKRSNSFGAGIGLQIHLEK